MSKEIKMPAGGATSDVSVIHKWYKNVGEKISRGDLLFEIETDKAVIKVESFTKGTLLQRFFEEGDKVSAGTTVAIVGDKLQQDKSEPIKEEPAQSIAVIPSKSSSVNSEWTKITTGKLIATPLARRLLKDNDIDRSDLNRILQRSVIKKSDVISYMLEQENADVMNERIVDLDTLNLNSNTLTYTDQVLNENSDLASKNDDYVEIELSGIRKTIATRMKESLNQNAQYTLYSSVQMDSLLELREKVNLDSDQKITINDLFFMAVSKAVQDNPEVNVSLVNDKIRQWKQVNIGLAISIKTGLVVPVVNGVDKLRLSEIALQNQKNIENARNENFERIVLNGGTITISNLGMFGIDFFNAIINPPESCIISIGSVIEQPVVENQEIMIRKICKIGGSFDHRLIDGSLGAKFLQSLKHYLENPLKLLV